MSIWMIRAGKHGEDEQTALDRGIVTIGWNELPTLEGCEDRESVAEVYSNINPDAPPAKTANHVGQIWAFRGRIQSGDLVVLPLKTQSAVAIGRVSGSYEFRNDLGEEVHHVRGVEWIETSLPRTAFDQDLLHSFGAFMTVCQIKRNNAEQRISRILSGHHETGSLETEDDSGDASSFDIEQAARDQILQHIQRNFTGHDLATLVDAVLQAEGYLTRVSPPGPDGGVDILAGGGPMGFDDPRICVQVKSSNDTSDVNVLRGLQGILQNFQANQGLLVSWGGFKTSVIKEARQSFFTIRLWDSGDLLHAILKNYDKFPDELKAELPLKGVWALVLDD